MKSSDAAVSALTSVLSLKPGKQLKDVLQQLAVRGVPEDRHLAADYVKMHGHVATYLASEIPDVEDLLHAQASVWRMAGKTPENKRSVFIPLFLRLLALMGCSGDALEMKRRYM